MIESELIEAFLHIAEYGNLTSAAAHTFTTQSNLSKQMRMLEEEAGAKLLIRHKGRSETELTEAGKEFLKTARKWRDVMREFDEVRYTARVREVSLATVERINSVTLTGFYRSVLKDMPDIRLDIHTRHSKEIYTMMENRQIDLGIVTMNLPVFNIRNRYICDEKMSVCVFGETYDEVIEPSALDPQKEIYSRWSDEFEVWHDAYFPGRKYRIYTGTSTMVPSYLDEKGRWAVVPESMTAGMRGMPGISFHQFPVKMPSGRLYLLEQKHLRKDREEAVNMIRDGILNVLQGK